MGTRPWEPRPPRRRPATGEAAGEATETKPAPKRREEPSDERLPHRDRRRRDVHRRRRPAPDGVLVVEKAPTTPDDQSRGVVDAIAPDRRGRAARTSTALAGADRGHRARHDDRRQHDDPDVGRADRAARHPGLPRRDRDAALLQGGHLGPGAAARRTRSPARRVRLEIDRAHDRRGRGRSTPSTRTACVRASAACRRSGVQLDRGRVPALLHQPRSTSCAPAS